MRFLAKASLFAGPLRRRRLDPPRQPTLRASVKALSKHENSYLAIAVPPVALVVLCMAILLLRAHELRVDTSRPFINAPRTP
jgi:hypothetical protein